MYLIILIVFLRFDLKTSYSNKKYKYLKIENNRKNKGRILK